MLEVWNQTFVCGIFLCLLAERIYIENGLIEIYRPKNLRLLLASMYHVQCIYIYIHILNIYWHAPLH
jgi:hypothetical protein